MGKIKNTTVEPTDLWELESDVRSMARAHAIKQDPEYHKKVKAHAKSMMANAKRQRDEHAAVVEMAED
jgi:hypothetical protein